MGHLKVHENYSLRAHNSFKINVLADYYVEIHEKDELADLFNDAKLASLPRYVLGGGTNTVFLEDFHGLVINICIPGRDVALEDEQSVTYQFGAGEDWPEMVDFIVAQDLGGIENLTYIPGKVGAAPIQNIAAYGQVQEDSFVEVEAFDTESHQFVKIPKSECGFSYRSSVFKRELKNRYIICNVTYRFLRNMHYVVEDSYHSSVPEESVYDRLRQLGEPPYTVAQVSSIIKDIRQKKLPDVKEFGTCGSFFLNPFIKGAQLKKLLEIYPNLQFYPTDKMKYPKVEDIKIQDEDDFKIPAAWIFDKVLGWSGKRIGSLGCWPTQSICIVNYGGATAQELKDFINLMKSDFYKTTGIELQPEVNLVTANIS